MRQELIEAKTKKEAEKQAPWACKFMKVVGGYIAFESITDYETAKNQK